MTRRHRKDTRRLKELSPTKTKQNKTRRGGLFFFRASKKQNHAAAFGINIVPSTHRRRSQLFQPHQLQRRVRACSPAAPHCAQPYSEDARSEKQNLNTNPQTFKKTPKKTQEQSPPQKKMLAKQISAFRSFRVCSHLWRAYLRVFPLYLGQERRDLLNLADARVSVQKQLTPVGRHPQAVAKPRLLFLSLRKKR